MANGKMDGQWLKATVCANEHERRLGDFTRISAVAFSVSAVLAVSLAETITMPANAANVHVLSHPLVNTRLAKLRQVSTTSKEFREVMSITSYPGQLCL